MGKAKRFNVYDGAVSSSRKIVAGYGEARQKLSVGSSFRNMPLAPPKSTVGTASSSSSFFGLGDPIILSEVDLGNISGGVNVDWSLANKFRGVLVGNVTISFINTPPNQGFYQQIILELRQDATGGRTISFADTFENDHTPLANTDADQYNVWAFYASHRGTEPIFSFNTYQSIALSYALSDELSPLSAPSTTTPASVVRSPFPMTLTEVRTSLRNTGAGGGNVTVDIHESGTTILSTLITIDNGEKTSKTAATPAVISDAAIADDAELEFFLTARDGSNVASGLKVTLIGYIS